MASNMHGEMRRLEIVALARADGRVDVLEAAERFSVSPETIRRDINELDSRGLIKRVHGGGIPVERVGFENVWVNRIASRLEEKRRIAAAALPHLEGAELIYFDEGSTLLTLAENFFPSQPSTIVTTSLHVALTLSGRENCTCIVIGGRVRPTSQATVEWANEMLDRLVIDLAVLGASGLTADRGCTCPERSVAEVKAKAIEVSNRAILLADRTKMGVNSSVRYAELSDFDAIITDTPPPADIADACRLAGQEVFVA